MQRHGLKRIVILLSVVVAVGQGASWVRAQTQPRRTTPRTSRARGAQKISAAQMNRAIDDYFRNKKGYQAGDLISQADTDAVLRNLSQLKWQPADVAKIRQATLPQTDFLVQLFSSTRGRKFMRQVKNEKLIYDRLDRIARVPQGKQMLSDLVKLPDGHRYASTTRKRGVPDLLDLLPKRGSSRTRSIKDYDRPTGKIYTESQLRERLEKSRRGRHKS